MADAAHSSEMEPALREAVIDAMMTAKESEGAGTTGVGGENYCNHFLDYMRSIGYFTSPYLRYMP